MGLLNYTTKIDADQTAGEIAKMLSKAGARAVLTEYDPVSSQVIAVSFKMNLKGQDIGFRLPCDPKPVFDVLIKGKKMHPNWSKLYERQQSEYRAQSVRTAWRIVKNWIEAQLAIIETKMVTTEQVFLPYAIMKDGQTVGDRMLNGDNPLLLN